MITPPTGEQVTLSNFVSSSRQLIPKLNDIRLPYKTSRREKLKFTFEYMPDKVGLDMVVVHFRGKVGNHYLIHPMKFIIRVNKFNYDVNLYNTHIYLDEGDSYDHTVWFKNPLKKMVRIQTIETTHTHMKKVLPWYMDVSF